MINNNLSAPSCKQMPHGTEKGLVTQHESGVAFDRQIKIRFLQQSASYLGADIAQPELTARYLQN